MQPAMKLGKGRLQSCQEEEEITEAHTDLESQGFQGKYYPEEAQG